MNKKYGYVRVATVTPELKIANLEFNTQEIIKEINTLSQEGVEIALFPELSLTGYTCADLFNQDLTITSIPKYLQKITESTKDLEMISIIGAPIFVDNQLFNCAIVLQKGSILGIVPKTYIPNYNEFYELRWFSSATNLKSKIINILNQEIPIGNDLLFQSSKDPNLTFGIEICEDLWCPNAPSTKGCLNGATLIFNLSASNETIGKYEYRKNLIKMQSAKNICAYIYASSGVNESSTDLVFSGYQAIYELGTCLKENNRFDFNTNHLIMDVDNQLIINNRIKNKSLMKLNDEITYRYVKFQSNIANNNLLRDYKQYPFVPQNNPDLATRCQEIIKIQSFGLAKRLKATNLKKCVIGMSGGLDSTLAFLVTLEAYKILNISNDNLIGITMPGFGTTTRTYQNALNLLKSYHTTIKEIDIKNACLTHFQDISLPDNDRSITYENSQARERTQILMDIANKEQCLVIGTGDLSELALGWCTYNGDHMSSYAVNTSIPKTLVRTLVKYFADIEPNKKCQITLLDILNTPISPELLPPDQNGQMAQLTETSVGPYVLHDFFLYHFLRQGMTPAKIKFIALKTFHGVYDEPTITHWLKFFFKRFFTQQFKRSCLPDGPKVGSISLSPRGDLRLPSDCDYTSFLNDL